MRTEVDSVGAAPSTGSNWVKEELGCANDQTLSLRKPSIFGGVGVLTATIDLCDDPARAKVEIENRRISNLSCIEIALTGPTEEI
jgi:hypothetical protein